MLKNLPMLVIVLEVQAGNKTKPLISCLMVAKPDAKNFIFFRKSLDSFLQQDYPNLELVVILNRLTSSELLLARKYLRSLRAPRIRFEVVAGNPSLGYLRNRAIDRSRGEFLCLWDSDDLSHPTRVSEQYRSLKNGRKVATYLQQTFHVFIGRRIVFFSDWSRISENPDIPRGVPGTLMFAREVKARFKESGPRSQTDEDDFFYRLIWRRYPGRVAYVDSPLPLYVYIYHGGNQFGEMHHFLTARGLSVSSRELKARKLAISRRLRSFTLPVDGALDVYSGEKKLFTVG